jgi:hypothetical protein
MERGVVYSRSGGKDKNPQRGCVITGQVLQGRNQWGVAASMESPGAKPCKMGCGSRSGGTGCGGVEGDQM